MNIVQFNKQDDLMTFIVDFYEYPTEVIKASAIDTSTEPFIYFIKEINKDEFKMVAMFQMKDIKSIKVEQ